MLAALRRYPSCQILSESASGLDRMMHVTDQSYSPLLPNATVVPGHIHLVVEPHGEDFSSQTEAHNNLHDDPMESAGLENMELRRTCCGVGCPNLVL
jgi:hypothetical protein